MAQDKQAGKTPESNPESPRHTGQPTPPPAGDARSDEGKQEQNRRHLGVDEDHQTPDMKKGHRGTFP